MEARCILSPNPKKRRRGRPPALTVITSDDNSKDNVDSVIVNKSCDLSTRSSVSLSAVDDLVNNSSQKILNQQNRLIQQKFISTTLSKPLIPSSPVPTSVGGIDTVKVQKISIDKICDRILQRLMVEGILSVNDIIHDFPDVNKDTLQSILDMLHIIGLVVPIKLSKSITSSFNNCLSLNLTNGNNSNTANNSNFNSSSLSSMSSTNSSSAFSSAFVESSTFSESLNSNSVALSDVHTSSGSSISLSISTSPSGSTSSTSSKSTSRQASSTTTTSTSFPIHSMASTCTTNVPNSNTLAPVISTSTAALPTPNSTNSSCQPLNMMYTLQGFARGIESFNLNFIETVITQKQQNSKSIQDRIKVLRVSEIVFMLLHKEYHLLMYSLNFELHNFYFFHKDLTMNTNEISKHELLSMSKAFVKNSFDSNPAIMQEQLYADFSHCLSQR